MSRLAPDGSLLTTAFPLGRNSDNVPTSMFVADGDLLFGDAAERRGITDPHRLVREFKRRVGDDVPIVAGDRRFRPEEVFALMVGWVVDTVSVREGRLPSAIAVTVPAAWGEYRTQRVEDALARHGWASVTLVTEPEAAARHYVATNPLPVGGALAVYDLGGGTFDAIVLRRDKSGEIHMAGAPTGLENVGGADFDDLLLRHAIAVGGLTADDLGDERVALAAFRRECVDAKEALSFDSEAVIPLLVGGRVGTVRVTRAEFERMIEEPISRTADVLDEAIRSSKVKTDRLDAILLTGGSSRIPRIAQLLSERFNRPIAVDADPKAIIAMGAARTLSDRAGITYVAEPATAESALADEIDAIGASVPAAGALAAGAAAGAAADDAEQAKAKRRSWLQIGAAAAGLVVVGTSLTMSALASSTSLQASSNQGTIKTAAALKSFNQLLPQGGAGAVPVTAPMAAAPQAPAPAPPLIAQPSTPDSKSLASRFQTPSNVGNNSMAPSKNYTPPPPASSGSTSNGSSSGSSSTPTPTPTDTATSTPTPTPTETATSTPTPTPTDTATSTPTPTPTDTATSTPTPTPTQTATSTPTPTPTDTATSTPSPSASSTP